MTRSLGTGVKLFAVTAMLSLCVSFCTTTPDVNSRVLTSEDSSAAIDKARMEFERAFVVVRETEVSGADQAQLGSLVERLNLVIWMIDRAERLSRHGDIQEAIAQADRSVEFSQAVISEAMRSTYGTSRQDNSETILRFLMPPLISLLLAVGTYNGCKRWRKA